MNMSELDKAKTENQWQEVEYNRALAEHERLCMEDTRIDLENKRWDARLSEGDDYRHAHITFMNELDEMGCSVLTAALRRMGRLHKGKTITIELCSPGGLVDGGFVVFDEILLQRKLGTEVTIRVRGIAASMAAILLQAATTREIGPNARLMLHRASGGAVGTSDSLDDTVQEIRQLESQMYKILGERTHKPPAFWKKVLGKRKDMYYNAEQSLELGLVDGIE